MGVASKNVVSISSRRPFVLVILDGFGYADQNKYNAVEHAHTPHITQWLKKYPYALLKASGAAVGLPAGYIGNSEVGHLTIGAGRIIEQPLTMLNKALEDGTFFSNPRLVEKLTQFSIFSEKSGAKNSLHIMGLLSDAGVHSHEKHLYGFIKAALQCGVRNIVVHAFLDGRDVAPRSAEMYLERLENYLAAMRAEYGTQAHITLGSVMGRFYAMDRDNNGERTELAYRVLTDSSQGEKSRWQDLLAQQYARGISDEYIEPTNLDPAGIIKPGDGIIFFNFRPDRARQLTRAFIDFPFAFFITPVSYFYNTSPEKSALPATILFKKEPIPSPARPPSSPRLRRAGVECCVEGSTSVSRESVGFESSALPITVLYPEEPIPDTLKEVISRAGRTIFSIAETEKYAHVTYFFAGYHEAPFRGETQHLVPSLHVESFAKAPSMSAADITQAVLASLEHDPRDFYVINYANADMVGHSGDFEATVKAVECLDAQLAQLYAEIVEKKNGVLWITADHGKAEDMFDEKAGQVRTAHTANLVPFIEISRDYSSKALAQLRLQELADIAPHILSVMGIGAPDVMKK